MNINALSFDIEEYFHVHAFSDVILKRDWHRYESRVVPSTRTILRILRTHRTKATFFVLGWVAERWPDLIKEIHGEGHEIASHGYEHDAVHTLTAKQLAVDLLRAKEAIIAACPAAELAGYRAPSFSIDRSMSWAFDELNAAGFKYDSSVSAASLHDRYGDHHAPRFPYEVAPGILEIPTSTVRLFGKNLPAVGGGHFRIAPLDISRRAIRRINREGHSAVIYLHPWEFDTDQPRGHGAHWKARFRHYVNIGKTATRLERLLQEFPFGRMDNVFAEPISRIVVSDCSSAANQAEAV
ncbi:XrtA system polysaccharide deacetylase [Posidoniimonas corsicana]|uniref:XrtA system polysaccharide deacetylase n=1 Tax=Posidoniimonas corsicana TaxID=1938618 RepID=UPI0018D328C1|nr:XrtA system polysaccharide deacetylase [Posidoniimonas corsicana]